MTDLNLDLNLLTAGQPLEYQQKRGLIRMTGVDAKDFLQRMSTNNLKNLTGTHPMQTSFINNKGRLIDHALIFEMAINDFILVSSHQDSQVLLSWLSQFHFVEDLEAVDISNEFAVSMVISSKTMDNIADTGIKCWEADLNGGQVNFYTILTAPKPITKTYDTHFETLRIACLMPACPFEINDSYMPQNANLSDFIAEDKGCYIGQEVIAKAKTYQKHVRTLCGALIAKEDFPRVKLGMQVVSEGEESGIITSIAPIFVGGFANVLVMTEPAVKGASRIDVETIRTKEPFLKRNANNLT